MIGGKVMKAMVLKALADLKKESRPLVQEVLPDPVIEEDEILIRISRCGICHTELDEIEGRTPPSFLPMVLGHQVVGYVVERGKDSPHHVGDRVGVGWIYSSCGTCRQCERGLENLCGYFKATGRDAFGGYAQYMKVKGDFAYPIPKGLSDSEAAPLLCAGAIGYRSLRLANIKDGDALGLTGFGASGHLVLKMVKFMYPKTDVFVFARSPREREFALELGASWAGDSLEQAPVKLQAIIDTTPVWTPIIGALNNLDSNGRLVINAIRKEDMDKDVLGTIDYASQLWMEKEIKSVANVARRDIIEFLNLADKMSLKPEYQEYDMQEANEALLELKNRKIKGAKVLVIE
jgi:propanol-preferring alcohol dehydrogenase